MQAVNWLLISYYNLSFLDLSVGKKYISRK